MKKKNKSAQVASEPDVELNVMPFIDIFSLLCTFLLFTAAFLAIGVIEVQVPFLSNAAPPENQKPKREITINLEIEENKLILQTSYTEAPRNERSESFPNTKQGMENLHVKLWDIKSQNTNSEKITVFIDDTIRYDNIVSVLDQVTLRNPSNKNNNQTNSTNSLFPKVVFGSVLL